MNRRDFLSTGGAMAAALAAAPCGLGNEPSSDDWHTYEVVTRVEIPNPSGATRLWLPVAAGSGVSFQKRLRHDYQADGGKAKVIKAGQAELEILTAEYPAGVKPVLEQTLVVATRDCSVNLSAPKKAGKSNDRQLEQFLQPTKLIPTDGIVRKTAFEITSNANSDVDKARAIYDWIVDNTARDPKTRGCGRGDIRFMLESKDLRGKCADLNSLYVGLARAAGLPARDVFGLRTGKSTLGYKSLGTSSEKATKAQHCRAQVHLRDYGWVPVDPADVRKVMLEEPPGNRPPDDGMVKSARSRLFGSWEMNWIAYNFAHDVNLPGSAGTSIGFFMYPQAETKDGRLDSLAPDDFKYEITAREISSQA